MGVGSRRATLGMPPRRPWPRRGADARIERVHLLRGQCRDSQRFTALCRALSMIRQSRNDKPEALFHVRYEPEPNSGCWLWIGTRTDNGRGLIYGKMQAYRKPWKAHRLSYHLLVGRIPEGLTIDHLCRNTLCVNPQHLEPVTAGENVLRGQGPSARASRQLLCGCGRPFTSRTKKRGSRICHTCNARRAREFRARRRCG